MNASIINDSRCKAYYLLGLTGLLILPAIANEFFIFQIAALSLILGTIALSLTLLAGYGGMISLSQMTIAGLAGYFLALMGSSSADNSLGLLPLIAIPAAIRSEEHTSEIQPIM